MTLPVIVFYLFCYKKLLKQEIKEYYIYSDQSEARLSINLWTLGLIKEKVGLKTVS